MKKVYIAHSKDIDYLNDIYIPIRSDIEFKDYEIILPHESKDRNNNNRSFYKTLDLVIAEVSKAATGMGIELGWAYDDGIPIYCFYKTGEKYSYSIKAITKDENIIEYYDKADFLSKIKNILNNKL